MLLATSRCRVGFLSYSFHERRTTHRIADLRHIPPSIPPRSGHSPELFRRLRDTANVRRARDRHVLVTFSGNPWGTGMLNRLKIRCPRTGWDSGETERRLHPDGPKLKSVFDKESDYIGLLNDTIFCPQAAGVTGTNFFSSLVIHFRGICVLTTPY